MRLLFRRFLGRLRHNAFNRGMGFGAGVGKRLFILRHRCLGGFGRVRRGLELGLQLYLAYCLASI